MKEIAGWVRDTNIAALMQHLAVYTGTRWDETDQETLDALLPHTDADSKAWFDYPIAGQPPVLVHLANDIGTEFVLVRVVGDLSDVLAARLDTLIDVL